MQVAFCAAEAFPFIKTGGLGDVCGTLPLFLEKIGIQVTIFLPFYKNIDRAKFAIERMEQGVYRTKVGKNIPVYLIENDRFFGREGVYGDPAGDYADNLERFQYYCLEVIRLLKRFDLKTDIVHCHDWHAALIPVYLKESHADDDFYASMKSVLTIHNLAHQGIFPRHEYHKLNLRHDLFGLSGFEFFGKLNLLKTGIIYSDKITTVSKQYAKEIQTHHFGCGLDGVLRSRGDEITGIVNGIDQDAWNPMTDPLIKKRYSPSDCAKSKQENKVHLQQAVGLPVAADVPLFGFVGRLSHQKGMDLILKILHDSHALKMQVLILGIGEEKYHRQLNDAARHDPERIAVCLQFGENRAHQVYAGSDFLLMPSCFEPCGLSQMIGLRYGTIPVVYKTGGLADTVSPFDGQSGNGFVFEDYTKKALIETMQKAVGVFHIPDQFRRLRDNAFDSDFSWDQSVKEYRKVYQCLLSA